MLTAYRCFICIWEAAGVPAAADDAVGLATEREDPISEELKLSAVGRSSAFVLCLVSTELLELSQETVMHRSSHISFHTEAYNTLKQFYH